MDRYGWTHRVAHALRIPAPNRIEGHGVARDGSCLPFSGRCALAQRGRCSNIDTEIGSVKSHCRVAPVLSDSGTLRTDNMKQRNGRYGVRCSWPDRASVELFTCLSCRSVLLSSEWNVIGARTLDYNHPRLKSGCTCSGLLLDRSLLVFQRGGR